MQNRLTLLYSLGNLSCIHQNDNNNDYIEGSNFSIFVRRTGLLRASQNSASDFLSKSLLFCLSIYLPVSLNKFLYVSMSVNRSPPVSIIPFRTPTISSSRSSPPNRVSQGFLSTQRCLDCRDVDFFLRSRFDSLYSNQLKKQSVNTICRNTYQSKTQNKPNQFKQTKNGPPDPNHPPAPIPHYIYMI